MLETYEKHLDLDYYIDNDHWNSDVNRHLDKDRIQAISDSVKARIDYLIANFVLKSR